MDAPDVQCSDYDVWKPPVYNVLPNSIPPLLLETQLGPDADTKYNFARTVQWQVFRQHFLKRSDLIPRRCADGSSALLQCENRTFQLFDA